MADLASVVREGMAGESDYDITMGQCKSHLHTCSSSSQSGSSQSRQYCSSQKRTVSCVVTSIVALVCVLLVVLFNDFCNSAYAMGLFPEELFNPNLARTFPFAFTINDIEQVSADTWLATHPHQPCKLSAHCLPGPSHLGSLMSC